MLPTYGDAALAPWFDMMEARLNIAAWPVAPNENNDQLMRIISAHVMGGCMMSGDAGRGVVDADGRYYGLANLSVHDGSIFPTSIGADPQLSIYAMVARMASTLAQSLTGQPAAVPVAEPG